MEIWEYIMLFLSVIIGGGIALYFKQSNKTWLQLVLSFSGAYILGITVLHLLPSVFASHNHHIGLYILLGFFIQLLLEQLSVGVEHGHIHAPHRARNSFAIQVMIGLCVHAFIEGLPLSNYGDLHEMHHHGHSHGHSHLLYGIILHKAPAAFALVLLLLLSKFKNSIIIACLFIFALMSPLGAALGAYLQFDVQTLNIVLAVVVGSFLHIATTIIFEIDGTSHHTLSWKKLTAILLGMVLALGTLI